MRQNAYHINFKCIFEDLLPCYCYATKANSKTIRSRVSQPASAGKEAELSELHVTRTGNLSLVQCKCHIGKKVSLQELTQLIRIKLLISHFLENFPSYFQFPAGANAHFAPPPADAHG